MVQVSLERERLVFELQGSDRFWALRSRLEIPVAHVRAARVDPQVAHGWLKSIKLVGTHLPGVIAAGTFYQHEGLVFWDVRHAEKTIVLDLDHEHYKQLIIDVEDPESVVRMIQGIAVVGTRRAEGRS